MSVDAVAPRSFTNQTQKVQVRRVYRKPMATVHRRRGMLSSGVMLLRDNARPQASEKNNNFFNSLRGKFSTTHPRIFTFFEIERFFWQEQVFTIMKT